MNRELYRALSLTGSTCGKRYGIALDRAELAWLGAGKMSPAPGRPRFRDTALTES